MVDERPDDTGSSSESTGPKRPAPTVDVETTDVSAEPPAASAEVPEASAPEPEPTPEPEPEPVAVAPRPEPPPPKPPKPVSPWVIAPISGAVAAALVIGVGWLLGWPEIQPAAPAVPQPAVAAIDALMVRVAGLETKAGKPAAPVTDPAAAAKIDALEKSLSALRSDLSAWRAQSEKLATAIGDGKAAPPPDLSAINDRIARIESAVRAQGAEVAAQVSKLADAKPADDMLLRRAMAASLLDVAVRHGDPYAAELAAAKSYADDAAALKPLEAFAATGVPSAGALCRQLVDIVPKLTPPKPEAATTGSGIVDRLQAGAAKLVRIQRSDASGAEPGSVVSRVMTAALRNDLAGAVRELKTLPPADLAAAQAWLDKVDARDAALAASHKFAEGAMAALAKAGQ